MQFSCSFKVLLLLYVNADLISSEAVRYGTSAGGSRNSGGGSSYTLPMFSVVVHQQLVNQRARNQAANSGSSNYLGNSGNWANPNIANVVHGIPKPVAPPSHNEPEAESNSASREVSHEQDLMYEDESDNENRGGGGGGASFKYGDDDMAMVY